MTIEIKVANDHIKLPPSGSLDQSKIWVRKVTNGVVESLSPNQWGYLDFDPKRINVEQEIRIVYFDQLGKSHTCLAHVTVEDPTVEAKTARVSAGPSTPTHTTVMVNVMDTNGGIYCAGGDDVLPVGADVKTDAKWSVYYVESRTAQPVLIDSTKWTALDFDTSVEGITTGRIFATVNGTDYTCNRSVTITSIPLNQLAITTPSIPAAIVGTSYYTTFTADGTAPFLWAAANLPREFTIGTTTGILEGNPTVSETRTITVLVQDGQNLVASKDFQLVIRSSPEGEAPVITTTSLPDGRVSQYYEERVDANGDQPMTWVAEGLPSGLDIDESEGTIFGTPNAAFSGNITIKASNDYGQDTKTIQLRVVTSGVKPVIETTSLPDGIVGKSYKHKMSVTGTEPIMWTCGGLPSGLKMSNITGDIYGRPTVMGQYYVSITAVNNYGQSNVTLNLTII